MAARYRQSRDGAGYREEADSEVICEVGERETLSLSLSVAIIDSPLSERSDAICPASHRSDISVIRWQLS